MNGLLFSDGFMGHFDKFTSSAWNSLSRTIESLFAKKLQLGPNYHGQKAVVDLCIVLMLWGLMAVGRMAEAWRLSV